MISILILWQRNSIHLVRICIFFSYLNWVPAIPDYWCKISYRLTANIACKYLLRTPVSTLTLLCPIKCRYVLSSIYVFTIWSRLRQPLMSNNVDSYYYKTLPFCNFTILLHETKTMAIGILWCRMYLCSRVVKYFVVFWWKCNNFEA